MITDFQTNPPIGGTCLDFTITNLNKQYLITSNLDKMKKVFFSVLAICLLSSSAVIAGKSKPAKKQHAKKECPKSCPKMTCPAMCS
jgi:hypothetical protein